MLLGFFPLLQIIQEIYMIRLFKEEVSAQSPL